MRLFTNFALALLFATSFIGPSLGHAHQAKRHNVHRHSDLARREPGQVDTYKRDGGYRFTYFADGLGACGIFNVPSDFIVALNSAQFSQNMCFKMITITINGKSTQAQITDECPGCPYGGLDFSQGLFQFFSDLSAGVLYGSWTLVGDSPPPASSPPPPPPSPTSSDSPTPSWAPPPTSSPQQSPTPTSSSTTNSSGHSATSVSSGTSASAPSQTGNVTVTVGTVPGGNSLVIDDLNLALVYIGRLLMTAQSL